MFFNFFNSKKILLTSSVVVASLVLLVKSAEAGPFVIFQIFQYAILNLIVDAIILCALFCGGGGGGGGGEIADVSCSQSDEGTPCVVTNYCPDGNTEELPGIWSVTGNNDSYTGNTNTPHNQGSDEDLFDSNQYLCQCQVAWTSCSPTNYCGQQSSGIVGCNTCVDSNGDLVEAPPDANCTDFALNDDSLILNPEVVRIGDDISIAWDLGLNYPTNCTLEGPGINIIFTGPSDATGTVENVTVSGPHRYTLSCGTASISKDIKILPSLYES